MLTKSPLKEQSLFIYFFGKGTIFIRFIIDKLYAELTTSLFELETS